MQRNLEAKWTQTWLDKAMKDIWLMAKQESQVKPKKPKTENGRNKQRAHFVYFRETQSNDVTTVAAITHTPSWTGFRGFLSIL